MMFIINVVPMANPESLPIILEERDAEESCTQYTFGPDVEYVDKAFEEISASPDYTLLDPDAPYEEGDIVFYTDLLGTSASHVARIDENGTLISKFYGKPQVYRHTLWGEPVPEAIGYEACVAFRKNIPASSE